MWEVWQINSRETEEGEKLKNQRENNNLKKVASRKNRNVW